MNTAARLPLHALLGAACVFAVGCLPKPSTVATRSYVLSPFPALPPAGASAVRGPAIGIGNIRMPGYLLKTSIAVRSGTNEITYLESSLWAERLDTSLQRTLAANLSGLLPTDQIRLSSWSRGDASRAVYVRVDRFDVDSQGTGTLAAWWRITPGSSDPTLMSGEFRSSLSGPAPSLRPDAVASTMSQLAGQLSETIAKAIHHTLETTTEKP